MPSYALRVSEGSPAYALGASEGSPAYAKASAGRPVARVVARFKAGEGTAGDAGGLGDLVQAELGFSANLFQEFSETGEVDWFIG